VPLTEILVVLLALVSLILATGLVVLVKFNSARSRTSLRSRLQVQHLSLPPSGLVPTERELKRAMEDEQFTLHYQPKVDLDSRRVVGLEALLRWTSPKRGSVAPMHFIPLLEDSGMILDVGSWALRRARLDQMRWAASGLPVPRIAVNVSPVQLRQRDFVDRVLDAVGPASDAPLIDLELTESLVMENVEDSIEKIASIRSHGIGVAIDDFGTGYSSLAYLTKLPVQTLKIDKLFVHRMLLDDQSMTLVQTIISLAQSLRLSTVAEGVESEEEADMLEMLRCDQMQGFLVSHPVPMEEVERLLTEVRRA
jgi:EAL domain-containing protein (putative c-di-GMP-specific phosphodiesterase class I)